jgi:bacterioferritin-associated ferredoxin
MNKAFVREPDQTSDYCPRCGAEGEPVGQETLENYLSAEQLGRVSQRSNFCPTPRCAVAYFDGFERTILVSELGRAVYPKDPAAPICACFGLTGEQIEEDVAEGVATRTRAILEKATHCARLAANGRSCVAYVQKYYMQLLQAKQQT